MKNDDYNMKPVHEVFSNYDLLNVIDQKDNQLSFLLPQHWKLNLCAISKLDPTKYFIAMNNKIRVYNINHNGNISSKTNPIRILNPSQLNGYSINAIRVGQYIDKEFNLQEILVSIGDNGEIHIWNTRNLNLTPYQFSNEQSSTWGVCIHESGLLALSANNRRIKVYNLLILLANFQQQQQQQNESSQKYQYQQEQEQKPSLKNKSLSNILKDRLVITLRGHVHNVPCIDIDSSGRYLASCSIDQTCRLWDLAIGKEIGKKIITNKSRYDEGKAWCWGVKFIPSKQFKLTTCHHPNLTQQLLYRMDQYRPLSVIDLHLSYSARVPILHMNPTLDENNLFRLNQETDDENNDEFGPVITTTAAARLDDIVNDDDDDGHDHDHDHDDDDDDDDHEYEYEYEYDYDYDYDYPGVDVDANDDVVLDESLVEDGDHRHVYDPEFSRLSVDEDETTDPFAHYEDIDEHNDAALNWMEMNANYVNHTDEHSQNDYYSANSNDDLDIDDHNSNNEDNDDDDDDDVENSDNHSDDVNEHGQNTTDVIGNRISDAGDSGGNNNNDDDDDHGNDNDSNNHSDDDDDDYENIRHTYEEIRNRLLMQRPFDIETNNDEQSNNQQNNEDNEDNNNRTTVDDNNGTNLNRRTYREIFDSIRFPENVPAINEINDDDERNQRINFIANSLIRIIERERFERTNQSINNNNNDNDDNDDENDDNENGNQYTEGWDTPLEGLQPMDSNNYINIMDWNNDGTVSIRSRDGHRRNIPEFLQDSQEKKIPKDADYLMFTTKRDAYLLNPHTFDVLQKEKEVVAKVDLRSEHYIDAVDRLCFLEWIPELELCIIASQKGTVSLMRILQVELPNGKQTCLFNHEQFLPFYTQESVLYGLTVHKLYNDRFSCSPIYQLTLAYHNGNIKSYHISKKPNSDYFDVLSVL